MKQLKDVPCIRPIPGKWVDNRQHGALSFVSFGGLCLKLSLGTHFAQMTREQVQLLVHRLQEWLDAEQTLPWKGDPDYE